MKLQKLKSVNIMTISLLIVGYFVGNDVYGQDSNPIESEVKRRVESNLNRLVIPYLNNDLKTYRGQLYLELYGGTEIKRDIGAIEGDYYGKKSKEGPDLGFNERINLGQKEFNLRIMFDDYFYYDNPINGEDRHALNVMLTDIETDKKYYARAAFAKSNIFDVSGEKLQLKDEIDLDLKLDDKKLYGEEEKYFKDSRLRLKLTRRLLQTDGIYSAINHLNEIYDLMPAAIFTNLKKSGQMQVSPSWIGLTSSQIGQFVYNTYPNNSSCSQIMHEYVCSQSVNYKSLTGVYLNEDFKFKEIKTSITKLESSELKCGCERMPW